MPTKVVANAKMIRRLTITLSLLLFVFTLSAQTEMTWTYEDAYGNTIKIQNVSELPDQLDTTFFKNNLTGARLADSTQQWTIYIEKVTMTRKNKECDLKVIKIPKGADVTETVKWVGYSHYKLNLTKVGRGQYTVAGVEYLYSEN